jgi:S-DNA-T family DNA segregation ATPase FtsK/SpoIIIE
MGAKTRTRADDRERDRDRDREEGGRPGRRREILGIFLLALGVFSGLSLISSQLATGPSSSAGSNPSSMMLGPGGAATASGLYGLLGFASYLLVVAMLVLAWRAFRAESLVTGILEGVGVVSLFVAVTVLLHLSLASHAPHGHRHLQQGPGGLLGQWTAEVTASFIGTVGAALAATALLFSTLILLTDLRLREVAAVISWATRSLAAACWATARAVGRLVVAMFPRRGPAELDPGDDAVGPEELGAERAARAGARAGRRSNAALERGAGVRLAIPALADGEPSEPVRVGARRSGAGGANRPGPGRGAVSDIEAELAAGERPVEARGRSTPATEDGRDDEEGLDPMAEADRVASIWSDTSPPARDADEIAADALVIEEAPAGPGPIIVEPAWRTRLRERQEHAEHLAASAAAAAADDDGQPPHQRPTFIRLKDGAYKLPSTDLLEYVPPPGNDTDKQGLYEMAERLEQAMSNYGVRGKVREIHMGPVVTMFEFAPAPGTRTGKIANLEKDLAMALEAQAVRIVAPIPGKAVVGVEVPNQTREMVYLREILEDDCFTKANSKLQVALGKDIKGAPVSVNLAKMPHLLVAGTTGSGKSVAVNSMIVSLLYSASPEEVRFIMVDPKMLELSIYEGIPHLLLPVVTDPKKANLALRWAVDEMERRYEMLAKAGVRDIAGFNAKVEGELASVRARMTPPPPTEGAGPRGDASGVVGAPLDPNEVSGQAAAAQLARQVADGSEQDEAAAPPRQKLPYIVIVIDEFADLMMVAPKDVETSVARIAQKARAAGLHLILATQRPSVDVITGLIKANFPSRIALQVASRIDSRTILDQPGADTLLGNGDMLFSDRGLKLRRVHGAFLGDAEVHRIVEHLKTQAKPVYDLDILKPRDEDGEEGGAPAEDFSDALYDQAVAIVCETRQASVSYIQRRLQIGYNRSARLVEQMERDGIVGPANGAKPREVLAPAGEYLQHAG